MKKLKNCIPKNMNNRKIKHYKTESTLKSKIFTNAHSLNKNIVKIFHYRLFKLNETNKNNKQLNINQQSTNKELSSNILVKNYNKNNRITTNYFNRNKTSLKLIPKNLNNIKYYSPEIDNTKINNYVKNKRFKNNINNRMKFGLFPLYYLKNKDNKINKLIKQKIITKNLNNDKGEYYKNNIDNDNFSKTNYTNNNNYLMKVKKSFNLNKKKNNSNYETDENDMKPKIRFINLKKDLLEENLKINKMFADFNREIAEKEKSLKFIGKYLIKNNKDDKLKNI